MKQIFLFLAILVVSTGCKKDKEKPKEILLSEIKIDGAINIRAQYSSENKLTQMETFSAGALSARFECKYDAGGNLSEMSTYTFPGQTPVHKVLIENDNQGRIKSVNTYELQGASPNTPVSTAIYYYNTAGLISKVERRDIDDKFLYSTNLLYYPDGSLEEVQTFRPNGQLLWLSNKTVYSVGNDFYQDGSEQLSSILGPDFLANLYSESSQNYSYNQAGTILTQSNRLMSAREFNEDGSLRKQQRITVFVKPIKPQEESLLEFGYLLK